MNMETEIIWLLVGIVLLFAEFFIPSFVIAFFGGGALLTALSTWVGITPTIQGQLLVFILTSILLLVILRRYLKRIFMGRTQDEDDAHSFNIEIGKIVPVVEYIQPGEVGGKVRYQGTNWEARADEAVAPGESVRITGCDNITLLVERTQEREEGTSTQNKEE